MNRKLRGVLCVVFIIVFVALCGSMLYMGTQVKPSGDHQTDGDSAMPDDIFDYVAKGDLDAVVRELDNGVDINITYEINHRTLLHYALYYDQDEIAVYLIEHGIDTDVVDAYSSTPIMLAIYAGKQEIYELLKDKCDLTLRDEQGNTLLHLSAASGNVDIYEDLVSGGLDPAQENGSGKSSLFYAGTQQMLLNIMDHLDMDVIDEKTAREMLFTATSADIIDYLIDNNLVDVNFTDEYGANALVYAMSNGEEEVFRQLVHKGIDINHQDSDGNTALHICGYDGYVEFAQILLSANADKSIVNHEDYTAYEAAKAMQNEEVAELLGGQ